MDHSAEEREEAVQRGAGDGFTDGDDLSHAQPGAIPATQGVFGDSDSEGEFDTQAILQHLETMDMEDGDRAGDSNDEVLADGGEAQRAATGAWAGPSSGPPAAAPSDYNALLQQRQAKGAARGGRGGRGRGRGRQSTATAAAAAEEELQELLLSGGSLLKRRKRQSRADNLRKRNTVRRGMPISETVTAKLGEANLLYASGDLVGSLALLKDVVRLAPGVPDSYQTLALIHEARGQPRKALDFMMIAAHLGPRDAAPWRHLASLSVEEGNLRQAIYCLARVYRLDGTDIDALWDRAVLYVEIEEWAKAAAVLQKLRAQRPDDAEVAKMVARCQHRLRSPEQAAATLEDVLRRCPANCDLTLINILAELYVDAQRYPDAIALTERARVMFCAGGEPLPLDLVAKAAVSLICLGDVPRAEELVEKLLEADVADYADLYRDVAEALWSVGEPARALRLLQPLRLVEAYDNPALWERLAACLVRCGDAPGAVDLYGKVTEQYPGHPEALSALAKLLLQQGRSADADAITGALEAASAMAATPEDAADLRLQAAALRLEAGNSEAFLRCALPPLLQSIGAIKAHAAAQAAAVTAAGYRPARAGARQQQHGLVHADSVFRGYVTRPKRKRTAKQREAQAAAEAAPVPAPPVVRGLFSDLGKFSLLLHACRTLVASGRAAEAAAVVRDATPFVRGLANSAFYVELRSLGAAIAGQQGDHMAAAMALRSVVSVRPDDVALWNLFARVAGRTGLARHASFVAKMRARNPDCVPAILMQSHYLSAQGAWGASLQELLCAFRQAPHQPLVCLMAAVALLHHGMSRRVSDRSRALLAAVAFLQRYSLLRGNAMEAAYNLGRAFHQLGVVHLALGFYERALLEPAPAQGAFDLRREAAHNMSLIYVASGAPSLARKVLRRFARV